MPFNLKAPWTVSLIRELWPQMGLRSVLRVRDYAIREKQGKLLEGKLLELNIKPPVQQKVFLREVGSDILTFNEVFLEQVYKSVLDHVPDCDSIIDIGANIGFASIYFAAHYRSCHVFAVEPNSSSYGILNLNMEKLINRGRCKTLQAAVWGDERPLGADPTKAPDHYSVFTTVAFEDSKVGEAPIAGLPMEKIIELSGFESVGLVKIDIEGAERELFKGDRQWLKKVSAIAIEFHDGSREAIGFDPLMSDFGFTVFDTNSHTVVAVRKR